DVQLGPVGQREDPDMLARTVFAVVEIPQLRALPAWIPLPVFVAETEDPLLGAGLLLVAARAAEYGVEPAFAHTAQQRGRLQPVAAAARAGVLGDPPGVDIVLDPAHEQA